MWWQVPISIGMVPAVSTAGFLYGGVAVTSAVTDHLLGSSGRVVQDRPIWSLRWADIPQLSIRGRHFPLSWQQYRQQSQRPVSLEDPGWELSAAAADNRPVIDTIQGRFQP